MKINIFHSKSINNPKVLTLFHNEEIEKFLFEIHRCIEGYKSVFEPFEWVHGFEVSM